MNQTFDQLNKTYSNISVKDLQNLDLSKYDPARMDTHDFEDVDFTPGGITEIDTETDDGEENILEKAKRINAEIKKPWAEKMATHPATGESVHDQFPGRPLEWLYGLPNNYGTPKTFIRDYGKRNEPYPFIDYIPNAEDIYKKRFP